MKTIAALSNLTSFHYFGGGVFFEALIAGLATPTLQNSLVVITDYTPTLASHLSRFINDVEQSHFAVQLILRKESFCFSFPC